SWLNWGFSLVFSAVLALEVARRVKGVDYRALAAAGFLGLGTLGAPGRSGRGARQMATPGALQPQIRDIVAHGGVVPGGIITFRHTIFLWQSVVSVLVEVVVVTLVMWLATPPLGQGKTARDLGIHPGPTDEIGHEDTKTRRPRGFLRAFVTSWQPDDATLTPGQRLEHSPLLMWLIVAIGGTYLVRYFMQAGDTLDALNLNILHLASLLVGLLL